MAGSFASFQQVADQLPFAIGDFEQASQSFRRWRSQQHPEDERLVELWTYCYVRRYFMIKLAKQSAQTAADLDDLVSKVYQKIERARASLKDPGRYAAWVSVICKNTFLNYLRREREYVSMEDEEANERPTLQADAPLATGNDAGRALQAVQRAIGRLPDYLAEAARLRFLEKQSYDEMSAATGKSKASMRTYVNRARKKLQQDPHLRAFWDPPDTSN